MQMMHRFFLAAALVTAPTLAVAHNELAREPRGIDALVPTSSPSQPGSSTQKITIYTSKTIVTLAPGTPTAQAVAVMNGKILGAGTLDEVRGWITNQDYEIDRRFQDAVIIPGFIEAHMHPQFTGVLWQVGTSAGSTGPRLTGHQSRDWRPNRRLSSGFKMPLQKYRLMEDG